MEIHVIEEEEAGFISQAEIFPVSAEIPVRQAMLEDSSCLEHGFEPGTDSCYKFC